MHESDMRDVAQAEENLIHRLSLTVFNSQSEGASRVKKEGETDCKLLH